MRDKVVLGSRVHAAVRRREAGDEGRVQVGMRAGWVWSGGVELGLGLVDRSWLGFSWLG